jgi:predicted metal-dependent hydrolase
MTGLEIRRIPFRFDETVPFQWHPTNAEFGVSMNALSIIAIAFEKYIVATMRQAMPLIDDPAVAEEADAFLRQEAQHARAHRLHVKALIAQHPGLEKTLAEAEASFDRLLETKPLRFNLAYIAGLEASFTPNFKLTLDHSDKLLTPGDARVASLLAWHFVEEIEHRSSALVVYNSVIGRKWYRLSVAPRAAAHVFAVAGRIMEGFAEHVPRDEAGIDVRGMHPFKGPLLKLRARLSFAGAAEPVQPIGPQIPKADNRAALLGVLRSQGPNHDPAHQPLPAYADRWFDAYRRGIDMTAFEGTSAPA